MEGVKDETESTLGKMKKLLLSSNSKLVTERKATEFDIVVGHIEDLLVDEQFYSLQKSYLERYWPEFEENEENKHTYMEIFYNYTNAIESHIKGHLEQKIPAFSMEKFIEELTRRKNDLDGEVFEVLFTLTDFLNFKEMFLDYRKMKLMGEMDLSSAISILPIGQSDTS